MILPVINPVELLTYIGPTGIFLWGLAWLSSQPPTKVQVDVGGSAEPATAAVPEQARSDTVAQAGKATLSCFWTSRSNAFAQDSVHLFHSHRLAGSLGLLLNLTVQPVGFRGLLLNPTLQPVGSLSLLLNLTNQPVGLSRPSPGPDPPAGQFSRSSP